jgi:uncharacterized protein (DUF2141 family)
MEKSIILSLVLFVTTLININTNTYSLTVKVNGLKNSDGTVIFAIYNKEGSIPDENFKEYYKKGQSKIKGESSEFTFNDLPLGHYAISVLHDENNNKKLDKKFMLPLPNEGIGFSNYENIGLNNRPNFGNASFILNKDTIITVKVIYK